MYVDSDTHPCVRSKRPRVYRHHVHMFFNMCARGAGTNGDVLNVHTPSYPPPLPQTTHTRKKKKTKRKKKSPPILLTKICPQKRYHVPQRFTKYSPDLTHFQNRASSIIERSALARCNILIIRNRNTPPDKDHHTTKRRQQDENTPNQPTTTRDTRHDSAPQHAHVYVHVYVCVYVHVGVHVHVGVSQAFDLPQWLNVPSLLTKCNHDKPHGGKTVNHKKKFPPGSKTANRSTA